MRQDEMTAEQLKANAEYYRKLNQQLIQKDNIIKLLQLKLKNLETNLGGSASEVPAEDEDRKGKGPRRMRGDEDRVKELTARIAELERNAERLTADLTVAQEELAQRDSGRSLPDAAQHSRDLEKLRTQLTEKNRELDKLRDEMAQSKTGERWPAGADPILKEDLAKAERELAGAQAEIARLAEQLQDLQSRPEPALAFTAGPAPTGDQATLMQMVIALLQKANELEPHLPGAGEPAMRAFKAHLTEIAKAAGIQRVRTVGAAFDPRVHQAVETVYSSEHPHSTVLQELSPGFSAQGAVVRMADVVVSLNPYWCSHCDKVALEGSRFCNVCGARVLGREKEGVRILDERATCLSQVELGSSHEVAGNTALAATHYEKALKIDPKSPRALAGMARVAEAEGHYDDALRYLDDVLPLEPDSSELHRARERILTKLRQLT